MLLCVVGGGTREQDNPGEEEDAHALPDGTVDVQRRRIDRRGATRNKALCETIEKGKGRGLSTAN